MHAQQDEPWGHGHCGAGSLAPSPGSVHVSSSGGWASGPAEEVTGRGPPCRPRRHWETDAQTVRSGRSMWQELGGRVGTR